MFWGILIGIVLTVLSVVLAISTGSREMKPLSYVVMVVVFVALCIEGVRMVDAIKTKRDIDDTVTILQGVVLNNLSSDARDYRIGSTDATAIMIGMRIVYPKLARYVDADDLVDHTVAEMTEVLRQAVLHNTSHKIWMNIVWMIVTMAIGIPLLIVTGDKGGRKVSSRRVSSSRASSSRGTGRRGEESRHDSYRRNPKYHSRSRR